MAAPSLRTCIGCRTVVPAAELARLALVAGRLVRWTRRRPAGRGASIHVREACVAKALRSGAFARAFRAQVASLEPGELMQLLTAATVRETP